ncbi:MAG: phosphodiester glycosidase family protein [Oscillospiraceae bacterium]|nr:phosphodiester glycosidase family protein [Oscillospiraceae bacterium]
MKPKKSFPRMKLLSILLVLAVFLSLQPAVRAEESAAVQEGPAAENTGLSIREIVDMVTAAAYEVAEKARHFTIPEDALVAPKPEYDCYGLCTRENAHEMLAVIQRARDSGLLGEDEVVAFDPDANFYAGYHAREIEYYLDDTIMVILWKENVEGKCCSFAEVKIADASQFRRKLANDSFGPGPQFLASELGEQVNAVVTMNADYYRPRHYGIVVYNRELCRFETEYAINNCLRYNCVDSMFVTSSGDFLYKRQGEEDTPESISAFIRENDILFSLAFGPVLVLDGEAVECRWYPMGEVHEGYSRAGIGQMGERHYLYMSLNHGNQEARWTINQFAQHFAKRPVQSAYALDGGQTQEIYFCGSCYNYMDFGVERPVSDIIYFATAIPEALRAKTDSD